MLGFLYIKTEFSWPTFTIPLSSVYDVDLGRRVGHGIILLGISELLVISIGYQELQSYLPKPHKHCYGWLIIKVNCRYMGVCLHRYGCRLPKLASDRRLSESEMLVEVRGHRTLT